jgi:hypothetical protein
MDRDPDKDGVPPIDPFDCDVLPRREKQGSTKCCSENEISPEFYSSVDDVNPETPRMVDGRMPGWIA